jgi:hypothetical protein
LITDAPLIICWDQLIMHKLSLLLEGEQFLYFNLDPLLLEFVHVQARVFCVLPINLGIQSIQRGFLWLWSLLRV